jgi:hypothetical protein
MDFFAGAATGKSLAASADAPNFSPMASAIQTSQWEKNPAEIGKLSVQPRSAVRRQRPITDATTADGVTRATKTSAACSEVATVRLSRDRSLGFENALTLRTDTGCNTSSTLVTDISSTTYKPRCTKTAKVSEILRGWYWQRGLNFSIFVAADI